MLCASVSCWARLFLQHSETQIFVNNPRNWWPNADWSPASREISLTVRVTLRFVFLTQQQRRNCVDVFISMRSASAAAQTPVDCSEPHQQPVDALLRPTFVQKPCYKLQSVVDFRFIQIFIKILSSSLNGAGVFAWYSVKIRVIFGVRFERRKVNKHVKTVKSLSSCLLTRAYNVTCSNLANSNTQRFSERSPGASEAIWLGARMASVVARDCSRGPGRSH